METIPHRPNTSRVKVKTSQRAGENGRRWPVNIVEAFARYTGPYNINNASTLLEEENLELYNGWPVWKPMTDFEERRIAGIIQEILSLAARFANFGQAYPDQIECKLSDKTVIKPDVSLVSRERAETRVQEEGPDKRLVFQGCPEMAVELRSPSNTRTEERRKRQQYFEHGTLVVWDVDPRKKKIWVYEVENPRKSTEYNVNDIISCERLLPGWQRPVADFFAKNLSAEQIVGEAAKQWREESREEGELQALRKVLLRQAGKRFGSEQLPADLEARLSILTIAQLNDLADSIAVSANLQAWLATFPV